jgi:hypothetical protein
MLLRLSAVSRSLCKYVDVDVDNQYIAISASRSLCKYSREYPFCTEYYR